MSPNNKRNAKRTTGKILRVLNVMEDGRIAGPQLRSLRIALALEGRVFTLVATPRRGSQEFKNALEKAGVPCTLASMTRLSRQPLNLALAIILMPWEILQLVKLIKREKIDVVHSSGGAVMFKSIIAARFASTPSVWHLNDTSSPAIFRYLARWLVKHYVSCVITEGSRVKEYYLPDFEENFRDGASLRLLEAPVDTRIFAPMQKSESNEKNRIFTIVTVGNLSPVKDYVTVVRAASLLEKKFHYKWKIIGWQYESQEKYRKLIDRLSKELEIKGLEFIGPSTDIAGHLRCCDLYVCSSSAEASPTAVWEAMASGLPIVSTDVGSVADHIPDGVGGLIIPPGDSYQMAQAIASLESDHGIRDSMGRRNRTHATQFLDLQNCANQHLSIFEEVVG